MAEKIAMVTFYLSTKLNGNIFFIKIELWSVFDKDLAELYQVETKQLNRQVRRNILRFPNDFIFQLTSKEYEVLKC